MFNNPAFNGSGLRDHALSCFSEEGLRTLAREVNDEIREFSTQASHVRNRLTLAGSRQGSDAVNDALIGPSERPVSSADAQSVVARTRYAPGAFASVLRILALRSRRPT